MAWGFTNKTYAPRLVLLYATGDEVIEASMDNSLISTFEYDMSLMWPAISELPNQIPV